MGVEEFVDVGCEADAVVEGAQLAPGEWLNVAGFDQGARAEAQSATGHGATVVVNPSVSAPKNPTGRKYKIINFNPVYEKVKIYRESNHKGSQGV